MQIENHDREAVILILKNTNDYRICGPFWDFSGKRWRADICIMQNIRVIDHREERIENILQARHFPCDRHWRFPEKCAQHIVRLMKT
jgi:hypothetical protein